MSLINSKNVLDLYGMEIHQKTSVPNHQKLKTMVKRSTYQKLRLRKFWTPEMRKSKQVQ